MKLIFAQSTIFLKLIRRLLLKISFIGLLKILPSGDIAAELLVVFIGKGPLNKLSACRLSQQVPYGLGIEGGIRIEFSELLVVLLEHNHENIDLAKL